MPPTPRRPNPVRQHREVRPPGIRAPGAPQFGKGSSSNRARPTKRACPNKECLSPNINEEGTCTNCDTIVTESNIVSEISFGETSSGMAVMQGSYVGEDQGAARSMGPGFHRSGSAGQSRQQTVIEAKSIMQGCAVQFGIAESTLQIGFRLFKLASDRNFIQGRRIDMVASVCLYTACRSDSTHRCNVMMMDFADRFEVNVFKLGHTFKALHKAVTLGTGIIPITPEDLMFRFALKLDSGKAAEDVAYTACRLASRMARDWIVVGRRPAGVCGACLILAARMHNFRRTVTEVVYIVKVTTATVQKRMEEFKITPSADLTVAEFMDGVFLESEHDPPSFYQLSGEYIKNKKTKKRKRKGSIPDEDDDEDENEDADEAEDSTACQAGTKRHKPANPGQSQATLETRKDADGFTIPAPPARASPPSSAQAGSKSEIEDRVMEAAAAETEDSLEDLVSEFGETVAVDADADNGEDDSDSTTPKQDKRFGPRYPPVNVPKSWSEDENAIENDMVHIIDQVDVVEKTSESDFDPNSDTFSAFLRKAQEQAKQLRANAEAANPRRKIRDEEEILETEFEDDPEVKNCLLSEEQVKIKEKIWTNENADWLRAQQVKEYEKREAANGPPKKRRKRTKGIQVGTMQTSPAASAADAATNILQKRALSKKINYQNIASLFEDIGALGSESTSRVTSRAASSVPESPAPDEILISDDGSDASESTPRPQTAASPEKVADPEPESEDEDDDDDHVTAAAEIQEISDDEVEDSWKPGKQIRGVDEGEEEGFASEVEENEVEDMEDINVFED